jgi:hypothetical protein
MVNESERTRFNNPVMVAGIWHYINVSIDAQDFQDLILKFHSGTSIPNEANRDETNYYEWKYDKNNQLWLDMKEYSGYVYINNESSQTIANTYSFCVGINSNAISNLIKGEIEYNNWTLKVYKDQTLLTSQVILVEEPVTGLAKSHGDILKFYVEPFTIMTDVADDYFKIENTGNIPLVISVDYAEYSDNIYVPELNTKIPADQSKSFDGILLQSESWKPGTLKKTGLITQGRIPEGYIITTANIVFETSPGINSPDIEISVGRYDYEIQEWPDNDIVFQYEKELELKEGKVTDIYIYISGNGIVQLNFRTDNISILKVFDESVADTPPLTISSNDDSEHEVKLRVKALKEDITSYIYYDLEIEDNVRTLKTTIQVGPPEKSKGEEPMNMTQIILIVMIIALVVGYMVYSRIGYY